jgi:hypothetical protein
VEASIVKRVRPSLLLCLLAADLILRMVVAFRPLDVIDGRTLPDDAYLSLELGRSIARGLGPWFSTGPTNGFQPLHVFCLVPAFWAFPHDPVAPVRAALLLSSVFDAATLWLLYRLVAAASVSRATPLVAAAAWIVNPYIIRTTLNGLETAMATFFLVAALTVFRRINLTPGLPSAVSAARLGAVLGLAGLARIDGLLLGPVLAAVLALRHRHDARGVARAIGVTALAAFVVYAPWLAYSHAYTGDLYPSSGPAVRLLALDNVWQGTPTWSNWWAPMLGKACAAIWAGSWPVLLALAATGIALAVHRPRGGRAGRRHREPGHRETPRPPGVLPAAFGFALLLVLAYAWVQFGSWYFDRYLYPVTFVLILGLCALFDRVAAVDSTRRLQVQTAFLLVGMFTCFGLHADTRRLTASAARKNRMGYMQVAQWAEHTFAPGTVVGSLQSGALAYFARSLEIVNLDGVVNKACLQAIQERRLLQYIQSTRVQWVLGWGINLEYIGHRSAVWEPRVIVDPQPVPGIESWGNRWYVVRVASANAAR